MKTLVTGSSGFIGNRLCSLLNKLGHELIEVSRSNDENSENHIACDLEKNNLDKKILYGVDTVFHLAGVAHNLYESKELEEKYVKLNINATKNLAIQASNAGVKTFVFISSVKAGKSDFKSNDKCLENGIYGKTKRLAEQELLKIAKKTDMKVCIVRPSLVYGPKLKGNLLEMQNAIQKGWFPPLPKIPNKRSMVHVDDLIFAILLVEKKGQNGEIYIITDGKSYSTTELYETFLDILKIKKPLIIRVPLLLLKLLRIIPGNLNFKIRKLLANEIYSPNKIEKLGFSAKLRFVNKNETLF